MLPAKKNEDAEDKEDALVQLFDDITETADKLCVIVLWLFAIVMSAYILEWLLR